MDKGSKLLQRHASRLGRFLAKDVLARWDVHGIPRLLKALPYRIRTDPLTPLCIIEKVSIERVNRNSKSFTNVLASSPSGSRLHNSKVVVRQTFASEGTNSSPKMFGTSLQGCHMVRNAKAQALMPSLCAYLPCAMVLNERNEQG